MAKGIYAGVTKTLGDYAEGDIIQLNESGSPVDFYVAKHNYESGLNGAGRTLLVRRYPYATIAWDDNRKNAYATSTSDAWLNSTYKSQLDENVRNALGVTSFYYTPGNGDNTVGTLSRAVFMLSMTEIGINATGSFNTEGTKITSCMLKPVSLPGSADNVPQWSRTPSITQLGYAFNEISGVQNPSNTMSASPYVRPAFTLPSTFEMIPDKARKVKKMYVGVENFTPRELPSGFTQLAFIGSTGTQYIDTGVMVGASNFSTLRVVADIIINSTGTDWRVSGCSGSNKGAGADAVFYFGTTPAGVFAYGDGGTDKEGPGTYNGKRSVFDLNVAAKTYTVSGQLAMTNIAFTTPANSKPFYISAYSYDGVAQPHSEDIYSYKFYQGASLIRDFVPCRRHSDGAAGLYDMITGAFYGNSGTGSFEEGPFEHKSTARKVKKAYVGDAQGLARLFFQDGIPIGTISVGNTVKLRVGGTAHDFIVVHQGTPGSMYGGGCDGTWLLMKDCYVKRKWHTNPANDYANSDIHNYLNGGFFNLLDGDVRASIQQVKIPYRPGDGYGGSISSGENGLPAKVFLLSAAELSFSGISETPRDEGVELAYFEGLTNGWEPKRCSTYAGESIYWWLRTPSTNTGNKMAMLVLDDGRLSRSTVSEYPYGVLPAFVLPFDFAMDESML